MGIYIFKHTVYPYIKVGHYIKLNPWSRIAHRGFRCCKSPSILEGQLMVDHLNLIAWYPDLVTADEKRLHKFFRTNRKDGEWYSIDKLQAITAYLDIRDKCDMMLCDKAAALATRRRL